MSRHHTPDRNPARPLAAAMIFGAASLILAGPSVAGPSNDQGFTTARQLRLQVGELEVRTLDRVEVEDRLTRLAARGSRRHAIVELSAGMADREALAAAGIELQSSLGGRTWIAAVDPRAATRTQELSEAIHFVREYDKSLRLHPFLADGNTPEWVVERKGRDPRVVFYLVAHEDVSLDEFEAVVADAGGEVRSRIRSINGLVVAARMSRIDGFTDLEELLWMEPALPALETQNNDARVNTGTNTVQIHPDYGLDGTGVAVMVYDAGRALAGHADFGGRLTVRDDSSLNDHATHVAGTIGGDGALSVGTHRGMAPGVRLDSYGIQQPGGLSQGFLYTDPADLETDYFDAIDVQGVDLTNNSIGTNLGWNGFPCEWMGDYGITSALIDRIAVDRDIRILWANGNERNDGCNTASGYATTAPPACAKNHITVGAINSNDSSITSFTSWGPTRDGRVKPDISAPGCQSDGDLGITSTSSSGGYTVMCGTSMATPVATGISALVLEEWRNVHPGEDDLHNAALKALLANTGTDLGHPGPDCRFGFGTVQAVDAIDAVREHLLIEDSAAEAEVDSYDVFVAPGTAELRITLAWDDAPGNPILVEALVNDLDLVVRDPSGAVIDPWTIDPADPGAAATRSGPDRLNNIEQVTMAFPMSGVWSIEVHGTSVPEGPQAYGLAHSAPELDLTPADECENSIAAIVGPNEIRTLGMTASEDAPQNGACDFLEMEGSPDAWFHFDAPVAGELSLSFCDSDFDTSVVVYRGECRALQQVACDDDSCAPDGPLYQSRIDRLRVNAGRHYIRVGGYRGATGLARFDLEFSAFGDECDHAIEIMAGQFIEFDTSGMTASAEPAEDGDCRFLNWSGSRDQWFRYKAPNDQTIAISLCESRYDTSMIVYQGSCDAMFRIGCDDDSCAPDGPGYQSKIDRIDVEAGEVFIRVGGWGGESGLGGIRLEVTDACTADVDGDGKVGAADMGALLATWGECGGCATDLDGDGRVDAVDMGILLSSWGLCG